MKHLSGKQRRMLYRILAAAVLFFPLLLLKEAGLWDFGGSRIVELLCFLVPYLIVGYDVLLKSFHNILHGRIFDEAFLMTVATIGAAVLGFLPGAESENAEAVGVMLFYQVGELFQSIAVGKSRRSIAALMDIRPDCANLIAEDGTVTETDPEEVPIGSLILVKPGERIPLDGVVEEGASSLDTAALTGEALPCDVSVGDSVISGCVNQSGVLKIRTTKAFGESTVSKILELVENSSEAKAKSERFITRFARYYTPVVVLTALAVALLPPLFSGVDFVPWVARALTFLVLSCPCALVISVPLSFFGGIGGASKHGILVKGANCFERLATAETVVFDKTGTLTRGCFTVMVLHPEEGITEDELLSLAAHVECCSSHPIALSLREAYGREINFAAVSEITELPGYGVRASVHGKSVSVGNARMMEAEGITLAVPREIGTVVHVLRDGTYLGCAVISDAVKPDASETVRTLSRLGVRRTVMLTGDRQAAAEKVAEELGIGEVRSELLPEDKVRIVAELLADKRGDEGTLVFVGDGINDAPVLARADVGVAMGAFGSDAAIEAADIVLMDDAPSKLATAIRLARKTLRIVRQNIVLAIGIKVLVMLLAVFGLASLWLAVFADVGVAVIAILNAMRTMR